MGKWTPLFFSGRRRLDYSSCLVQYQADPKGVLLDVRTREEYTHGHIPGSQNLPLQEVTRIGTMVPDQSTPLYVHCYSGARSGRAVTALRRMGYSHVSNTVSYTHLTLPTKLEV